MLVRIYRNNSEQGRNSEGKGKVGLTDLPAVMQKRSNKILEQAPVGIITLSAKGEIDYINQSFRKFGILYSFDTQSLIGVDVFNVDIFPYILQLKVGFFCEVKVIHQTFYIHFL